MSNKTNGGIVTDGTRESGRQSGGANGTDLSSGSPGGSPFNFGNMWLLLAVNVAIGLIVYAYYDSRLPDIIASHFNYAGEQDDSMSKGRFWLMYAAIGVALPSMLPFLRRIDPRKANYSRFEGYFTLIRWVLSLFLHGVFLLVIHANLDRDLPHMQILLGGLGLLWVLIGNRMGQLKSNFFIGIKTPWALSDESNWRLTHRLGARLWVAAGLIMFVCAWIVPVIGIVYVVLGCVLISAIIPVVYSYMLYARASKA